MDSGSLFPLSDHLQRLSKEGDPLEFPERPVEFQCFRGWLVEGLGYSDGPKGGRRICRKRKHRRCISDTSSADIETCRGALAISFRGRHFENAVSVARLGLLYPKKAVF
jgi:hypothetical protein